MCVAHNVCSSGAPQIPIRVKVTKLKSETSRTFLFAKIQFKEKNAAIESHQFIHSFVVVSQNRFFNTHQIIIVFQSQLT